ncbi:MAG TPA: hypothetical protein DDW23_07310 [Planctomycetes bacterium]|nr:hypothetical protein [Planctomycetota bacterium]
MPEEGNRPALALSHGSAWPSSVVTGSAYSLTTAKAFGANWSGYLSGSFVPDQSRWLFPGGITYQFKPSIRARGLWDGEQLHPGVSYVQDDWSLSAFILDGDDFTLSYSIGF